LVNHGDGSGSFKGENRIPISYDIIPLICADISGDGISDLIAARPPTLTLSTVINNGDGTFKPETLYQEISEGSPNDMIVVDVNNDGFNDILWLTKLDGSFPSDPDYFGLSVFMNNKDGTFADEVYYQLNGSNQDTRHLISTDLDKDGFLDVVLSNKATNNVSVFINNGDGTFKSEQTYSVGISPDILQAFDLNNDGHDDVITLNTDASAVGDNNISVLINNGDGTFKQSVEYDVGSSPNILKAADLNNDGSTDLIIGNYNSFDISILMNKGDGTFKTQEKYQVGNAQRSIEIADCNKDGYEDLLVAVAGNSPEILVFINQKDGTFDVTSIKIDYRIRSIVATDFDKDGDIDIIEIHSSGNFSEISLVSLILGKGDGTFMAPIYWYSMGTFPYYLFLYDMNNDQLLDIGIGHMYSVDVAIHWNTRDSFQ
jgi:hypothetical protein